MDDAFRKRRFRASDVRVRVVAFVSTLMLLTIASARAASDATHSPCPDEPKEFVVIADVATDLSLRLSDGRFIAMPGIEPPRATANHPSRPQSIADDLRDQLRHKTVGFAPLGPLTRWKILPGIVFTQEGPLAELLLAAGDVRLRPDRAARACREAMLAAEERGRTARLGVWSDPSLQIIDTDALEPETQPSAGALEGLTVIEGRVSSIGETPTRLYLNLGQRRGGFAISLPKRDMSLMESDAVRAARKVGTRLRVRGLIDRRVGLRVDLSDADAIEILSPSFTAIGSQ